MNKHELREKIISSRKELDSALARINERQMQLIILHGEWSVKDLLGHIGFWENRAANLYGILKAGEIPEPVQELDTINAEAISEMQKYSLEEAHSYEMSAYQKIMAVLDNATGDELFNPDHFAWTGGQPFEEIISNNTWGHYDEHMPEITAWLKRMA
jgi:hypothetical protein